jgi:hypothetical protein
VHEYSLEYPLLNGGELSCRKVSRDGKPQEALSFVDGVIGNLIELRLPRSHEVVLN